MFPVLDGPSLTIEAPLFNRPFCSLKCSEYATGNDKAEGVIMSSHKENRNVNGYNISKVWIRNLWAAYAEY